MVDDDAGIVRAMEVVLKRAGFDPVVCTSGADALDKAVAQIDAAVVDIHLPDISGLLLSQKLRDVLGPEIPIVVLSGDTSIETLRALPEACATHFFSKPVNTGLLVNSLEGMDREQIAAVIVRAEVLPEYLSQSQCRQQAIERSQTS